MHTDNGVLDFDAELASPELIQIPVKYKGKNYLLIEALADAVAKWKNAQISGATLQQDDRDQKTVSMGNMADSEILLVGMCLFYTTPQGGPVLLPNGDLQLNARVGKDAVKNWPNRIVSVLYDKVMEISRLNTRETLESIEKKITELTARRNRLLKEKEDKEDKESKDSNPIEEKVLAKN